MDTNGREVLGVNLAGLGQWRPLADMTTSKLMRALLSSCPREIIGVMLEDPSLCSWLLGQWPCAELQLGELSVLISDASEIELARRLRSSLEVRSMAAADWEQFRGWWIRATGLMRRMAASLDGLGDSERRTASAVAVGLAGEIGGPLLTIDAIPASLYAGDQESSILSAIESTLELIKTDPSPDACCVTKIEAHGLQMCLPELHDALPYLLDLVDRHSTLEQDFARQLERQKIAAMKELAYGASHEINNPLANISSRAQVLMRDEPNVERRRSLATINSQAFRAHEMIADMMLFAKPPALNRKELSIGELMSPIALQLERDLSETINFQFVMNDDAGRVSVDPDQIAVAVHAICANATEAMGDRGHLALRVQLASGSFEAQSRRLEVEIADDGPGISPTVRDHLFDPFYSGREAGRGLGFGLSKAWRIIESHGGEIRVHSEVGNGATFVMSLPLT